MLLEGKNAIIYGGGGSVGSAVARAFAREGARVFLAGRTMATLEKVAVQIDGHAAQVDALDEDQVNAHADAVVAQAGSIDISMNVISDTDVQGTPMVEMTLDDYIRPVITALSSKFLTSRAAARHMMKQGGGVILAFGGSVERSPLMHDYNFGGIQVTFDAVESMRRQLAIELGRYGIRVLSLRTSGIIDTIPEGYENRDKIARSILVQTLTGKAATLEDVGNVAAFAASDQARTITGTEINMTAGAALD
ncbi:SDR family NAD(P)-dependent oxidoreductase [Kibdelosporangium persicum]|uniref:NADP-dependent 3-hydroxy acid dehydrogenase YdfG n=1 Tax=Kibdelosporangium persicum TaxID=2698649 RepID=A0ABX2EWF7_9PSEU|nr:SDR family oxidoreductase [Kibdelosporangium persicum]NRN63091.1 NADP-dependent 3-hydroxy acid dehydrogenase YdfG [Kibdelosporangium persicum]